MCQMLVLEPVILRQLLLRVTRLRSLVGRHLHAVERKLGPAPLHTARVTTRRALPKLIRIFSASNEVNVDIAILALESNDCFDVVVGNLRPLTISFFGFLTAIDAAQVGGSVLRAPHPHIFDLLMQRWICLGGANLLIYI